MMERCCPTRSSRLAGATVSLLLLSVSCSESIDNKQPGDSGPGLDVAADGDDAIVQDTLSRGDMDVRPTDSASGGLDAAIDGADAAPRSGPDGDNEEDGSGDADAALSVSDGDLITDTKSWSPSEAPATCPALTPMCSLPWRLTPGSAAILSFWPHWQKLKQEHPFYAHAEPSAYSRWRPMALKQLDSQRVRLYAAWFNHQWSPKSNDPKRFHTAWLNGCSFLKPSLLPSGCVTLDIHTGLGAVVSYAFDATTPGGFGPSADDGLPTIYCGKALGPKLATGEPISLTMPGGAKVVASPGRASFHLLEADAKADISAVVRDLPSANTQTVAVGPVVEIFPPAASPGSATPTGVSVDVSVCRADNAQIAASGCACPKVTWPDPNKPPASGNYIRLELWGKARLLEPGLLSQIEHPHWRGDSYVKWAKMPGPEEKPVLGEANLCCYHGCPMDAWDWVCAGWSGYKVKPYYMYGAVADIMLLRTRYQVLRLHIGQELDKASVPVSVGMKPMFSVPFDPTKYLRAEDLYFVDGLAGMDLPARERDGAYVNYAWIVDSPTDPNVMNGSITLSKWTATTSEFEIEAPMLACRRHFVDKLDKGNGFMDWSKFEPCKPTKMKMKARLVRWQP